MKTVTIQIPDDCEIQIVKKEEKDNPVIKTYQDLLNNDIVIEGYRGNFISDITYTGKQKIRLLANNIAASRKVAKSMLAMAMISQLMPYYGGEISSKEWTDSDTRKYVIRKIGNHVCCDDYYTFYYFLAFHKREQRDEFLKYNEQLVKDYLMID